MLTSSLADSSEACAMLVNRTSQPHPHVERLERCECLGKHSVSIEDDCTLQENDYYSLTQDMEFCTKIPTVSPTALFPSLSPIRSTVAVEDACNFFLNLLHPGRPYHQRPSRMFKYSMNLI